MDQLDKIIYYKMDIILNIAALLSVEFFKYIPYYAQNLKFNLYQFIVIT